MSLFKGIARGTRRRRLSFKGINHYLLKATFDTTKLAEIGTLTYNEVDGVFTVVSGRLTYPSQSSPVLGDEYVKGQSITMLNDIAMVMVLELNQSTRNNAYIGWFTGAGINAVDRIALLTNSTAFSIATNLGTVSIGLSFSANVNYVTAAVARDLDADNNAEQYMQYLKADGLWRLLWVDISTRNDASAIPAFSNLNSVGSIDNFKVRPIASSIFNPPVSLSGSQAAGTTWQAPDGDFFLRFVLTTRPSAGSAIIQFRFKDVNNYWAHQINSAGLLSLEEVVLGASNVRASGGAVASGTDLTLVAEAETVRAYATGSLIYTYSSAFNFMRETASGLSSLGTGGVISNVQGWKKRGRDENGVGSELVIDGTMSSSVSNWPAVLTPTTRAYVGGRLQLIADVANEGAGQTISDLTIGSYYVVSVGYDVISGTWLIDIASNTVSGGLTGVGTVGFTFVATATSHQLRFLSSGGAGEAFFDNASMKVRQFTSEDSIAYELERVYNG